MIDLCKKILPSTICVEGNFFKIHTDFSYWIKFSQLLQKEGAKYGDFDFIYKSEKPENRKEGFEELLKFLNQPRLLPRKTGSSNIRLIDYELDSELIYSAFLEQYGIDLINEDTELHWFKFLALFFGLHDTKLNEIISFRMYEPSNRQDIKKTMMENKKAWELPSLMTEEEKEALELFDKKFAK